MQEVEKYRCTTVVRCTEPRLTSIVVRRFATWIFNRVNDREKHRVIRLVLLLGEDILGDGEKGIYIGH